MYDDLITPPKGTTCPALINEDYDYHLSGDAAKFCQCVLNNKRCVGIVVVDPDDQSSQFFSRGKCMLNKKEIKNCPAYGMSSETLKTMLKEKTERELNEKLDKMS